MLFWVSDFGFNFSITKKLGCPPRIPPKATILYEITLLDWNDRSGADTFENLNYEQKVKLSFQQKMKAATDYHKEVRKIVFFNFAFGCEMVLKMFYYYF